MMLFLITFLSSFVFADAPVHWNQLTEIRDRHEFYPDNQLIDKPKDSWQTLFSVVYTDIDLLQMKDCVYFRVPGAEAGALKIKSINAHDKCDKYILAPGDRDYTDIKSLQFAVTVKGIIVDFSTSDRSEKWKVETSNNFVKPKPGMHLSSAEYKTAEIILLSPRQFKANVVPESPLKKDSICHEINDDCKETKPSICSQCPEGWYEIPNGCQIGPKYCGRHSCGLKNQPACRRGMKWQRKDQEFDCRTDSSFAYCAKGLMTVCEGKKAFCR